MSLQFIKENIQKIAKETGCDDFIQTTLKWLTKRQIDPTQDEQTANKISSKRLMVVGGECVASPGFSKIEYYCPKLNKWKYWKIFPDARTSYAVAVLNNELYIVGGELKGECLKTVSIEKKVER